MASTGSPTPTNMELRADGSTTDEESGLDVTKLEELRDAVRQAEWRPGKQEYAVMITLAVISLMVALDATILVSVLPTLAVDFGGTSTDAFWAGTSYLLSCAVCQPFIAALSDIFGRKEMLLVSVIFFTLGTLLCAPIAKNFTVFFIGRAIQGIGGGGIITMGQVIFADIVPLRQRPKYFSIVLGAWALGSVLGPLIGGLFVEHAFWSWCFYLNFPFCAIGLILVPFCVKLHTEKTTFASKMSRVDWIGGFLFMGSMTSFLIGISWAGVQFAWNSAQVIAPIVIGVVGVAVAICWENWYAREPFIRSSLFCSTSAFAAYGCALFQGLILFCALYYVPFYFTAVRFTSPTQSGLNVFPVTCFLLPGSILISLLTTRLGRFRWAIWSGWVLAALSCGLFYYFNETTKTVVWAVILAVFGIGHGMLLTSVNVGIQAISNVEDAGRAAAMYAFMRTLGMSIGVAIGGTVFQNLMTKKLEELGLPVEIAHNSEAFVSEMALMDRNDPVRVGALEAYVKGFHGVYWTITGCAVAAFLVSLVIKRHSMDKLLTSKFVLKGARASTLAALTAVEPNEADLIRRLPQLAKTSSKPAQTTTAACDCPQTRQVPTCVSEKPLPETPSAEPSTGADAVAVAYYVEPDGKKVPFDILSTTAKSHAQEDSLNTRPGPAATLEKVDEGNPVCDSTTPESEFAAEQQFIYDGESQQTSPEEGSIREEDDIFRPCSPEQNDIDTAPTTATHSCEQLAEDVDEEHNTQNIQS
ncbi:Major facilitator superfamily domain containing protein, partial [Naviculisporaceae sp. PSN 640]